MRIEEVRIGTSVRMAAHRTVVRQQMQHVLDDLKGVVAVEHTRPEVDLPTQTPTRCHIATLVQRIGSSGEEVRMRIGRYLIRGIETIEMGDMTVLVLGVVAINHPLLQLAIATNLHRRQAFQGCTERCEF